MRFLKDNELPPAEQERRQAARDTIGHLQRHIDEEWNSAEPELIRMVKEGRYDQERAYRCAVYERTEHLRQQIAILLHELPPYIELRADGILERVAVER